MSEAPLRDEQRAVPPGTRTDAEKLRSAEITLATIRGHAERHATPENFNEHARGYRSAMRDVLAILDARWLPEGQPVMLGRD